jgi:hypothetical protein
MKIRTDSWVEVALDGDSAGFAGLIASLPASEDRSMAAFLARWPALESRVYGLRAVSREHSDGGDPELGAALAEVGILFCRRSYELHGTGTASTFVSGVMQFALDAHRAHARMGRRAKHLEVLDDAIQWLRARGVREIHLDDLRFARIDALIGQGRLEEARESLESEAAAGNTDHPSFDLLVQRISSRLISGHAQWLPEGRLSKKEGRS